MKNSFEFRKGEVYLCLSNSNCHKCGSAYYEIKICSVSAESRYCKIVTVKVSESKDVKQLEKESRYITADTLRQIVVEKLGDTKIKGKWFKKEKLVKLERF